MKKAFCDLCGVELTKSNTPQNTNGRLLARVRRVSVEVITGLDGVWNEADVCAPCIISVVQSYQPENLTPAAGGS